MILVANQQEGMIRAENLLYDSVDRKTVLFLSGGSTPRDLYAKVAREKRLTPGAVAMVDERYGKRLHQNSNEKMIKDTGLLSYLDSHNIRFYPILIEQVDRKNTALQYDETVRFLLSSFPKSVAILGIGTDGHIAGIPASSKFKVQSSKLTKEIEDGKLLVVDYNDKGGFYKERVTVTFLALARMDLLLVLVFGEDKKEALKKMFKEGSKEEIPARFFTQKRIVKKTLLITDQDINKQITQ